MIQSDVLQKNGINVPDLSNVIDDNWQELASYISALQNLQSSCNANHPMKAMLVGRALQDAEKFYTDFYDNLKSHSEIDSISFATTSLSHIQSTRSSYPSEYDPKIDQDHP